MLTYTEVTPVQLESLRAVLEKHGFILTGNSGEIKKLGADVTANYDPATQTLTVDIVKAPWVISADRFTRMLNGDIEAQLT